MSFTTATTKVRYFLNKELVLVSCTMCSTTNHATAEDFLAVKEMSDAMIADAC